MNVYEYLNRKCKEDGAMLFSVVPSLKKRGRLKHRRCPLNMRNFFCTVRVTEYWNKSPRGCRVSLLTDIKKLSGHCPGQLVRGDPT